MRVEQHPQRLAHGHDVDVADGQPRRDRRARCPARRRRPATRRGSRCASARASTLGDPLRAAVRRRGATVEAHRGLEQRERAAGRALVQVRARGSARRASAPTPTSTVDAGGAQPVRARDRATRGSGSSTRDDDPAHAGGDQRLGARRGVAVVVARLERDVGGGAARAVAGVARAQRPRRADRPGTAPVAPRPTISPSRTSTQPTHGLAGPRSGRARRASLAVAISSSSVPSSSHAPSGVTRVVQPTAEPTSHACARSSSPSPIRTLTVGPRISLVGSGWLPEVRGLPPWGGHRRSGLSPAPRGHSVVVDRTDSDRNGTRSISVSPTIQKWNTFLFWVRDPGRRGRRTGVSGGGRRRGGRGRGGRRGG